MRIQILDYQVGPHTFRMVKPSDFNIFKALPSLIPFITTIDTTQKVIFETEIDDDETTTKRTIAKTPDDICFNWEDADCIIRPLPHSSHLVSITPRKSGKNYWMECNDNFRQCFIHLPACRTETPAPENETNFVLNNFLMMLYAFNAARHHTLLMHASVVATETGKGYLFLGKSGTGKSTHLLAVLSGLNVLVGRKVIHYKGNAGLIKHAVLAKFVHLIDGNRRGHIVAKYHIQLGLNQLTGYHMIQTGVRRQDLLRHCHSHDHHRP